MAITAIVVNYNAGEWLAACIDALLADQSLHRILVIDNASQDGSARALEARLEGEPRVQLVFNADNPGFARGVNQGITAAGRDDVLVVNPDCLVEAGAVDVLHRAMAADAQAGMAAPLVLSASGEAERSTVRHLPGTLRAFATATGLHRLHHWFPGLAGVSAADGPLPTTTTAVEAVSGACMLVRREALDAVGTLDEGFAMHCEDLDLMARFADAGWHRLFVPAARAVHHQGQSSRSRPLWVHYQKHRGMGRYYNKHQAPAEPWPLRCLVLTGIWLRFLLTAPLALLKR